MRSAILACFTSANGNSEAEEKLQSCIRIAPDFDQPYVNLARLYALEQKKQKAREVLLDLLKRQPQQQSGSARTGNAKVNWRCNGIGRISGG